MPNLLTTKTWHKYARWCFKDIEIDKFWKLYAHVQSFKILFLYHQNRMLFSWWHVMVLVLELHQDFINYIKLLILLLIIKSFLSEMSSIQPYTINALWHLVYYENLVYKTVVFTTWLHRKKNIWVTLLVASWNRL